MEEIKTLEFKNEKVETYKGHDIYVSCNVPKEWIATIIEDGSIMINYEAYKILKDKPDYLENIYDHEIEFGANHEPHECPDKGVIDYLKNKGYDFGGFQFE